MSRRRRLLAVTTGYEATRFDDLTLEVAGGACVSADPEAFHPTKGEPGREARRVCASCPVRMACLELSLRSPAWTSGIWAGYGQAERADMRAYRTSLTEEAEFEAMIGAVSS